jgi:aspartate 1-decarboxylase
MPRRSAPAPVAGAVISGPVDAPRVQVVRAKLHGLHVTGADLDYHGSVTLDPDHCEAVGIQPLEFVDIWNRNSGARLSTYVIWGERGSRCCVLNGAAARTCQPGDAVILAASAFVPLEQAHLQRPRVAVFDEDNRIVDLLQYQVDRDGSGRLSFRTRKLRLPGKRRSR